MLDPRLRRLESLPGGTRRTRCRDRGDHAPKPTQGLRSTPFPKASRDHERRKRERERAGSIRVSDGDDDADSDDFPAVCLSKTHQENKLGSNSKSAVRWKGDDESKKVRKKKNTIICTTVSSNSLKPLCGNRSSDRSHLIPEQSALFSCCSTGCLPVSIILKKKKDEEESCECVFCCVRSMLGRFAALDASIAPLYYVSRSVSVITVSAAVASFSVMRMQSIIV